MLKACAASFLFAIASALRIPSGFVDTSLADLRECGVLGEHGFAVDIGAGVRDSDPVFKLYDLGWNGWMIDGDHLQLTKMKKRFPQEHISKNVGLVYPHNIIDLLDMGNVPSEPDLLKIDIDSFDCDVMNATLATYRPKVIIMEINEKIPPPIQYTVHYSPDLVFEPHVQGFFYGCSLAYQAERLMFPRSYALYGLAMNNVVFINENVIKDDKQYECMKARGNGFAGKALKEVYKSGYEDHWHAFGWNKPINHWRNAPDEDKVATILRDACRCQMHGSKQNKTNGLEGCPGIPEGQHMEIAVAGGESKHLVSKKSTHKILDSDSGMTFC